MKRMGGKMNEILGVIAAGPPTEEGRRKLVALMAECVEVDFRTFLQALELIAETGREPTPADIEEIFYVLWLRESGPLAQEIRRRLKEQSAYAQAVDQYIRGMGAKAKAANQGLCVADSLETVCSQCYFSAICRCPAKSQAIKK